MKSKKIIRDEVACIRKKLSREVVEQKSSEITERVINLDEFKSSKALMCYMDFNNEVMTRYLIEYCFKLGKRVILPLIDTINGIKQIVPCEIIDLDTDVKHGTFGILEPKKENARVFQIEKIDFVVVPGVSFDLGRNRIGYGAGFYDKFLNGLMPDCIKVGFAFEFQIYKSVPVEEHDVQLDLIITEDRII